MKTTSMKMNISLLLTMLLVVGFSAGITTPDSTARAWTACVPCADGQDYRLVYQTVYDQKEVTAYRIETETVYDEKEVVSYRPVWETVMREQRYRVAKPITETSYRDETYTVQKPVWETEMREESYDRTTYAKETSEREERRTVWKPVTETAERDEWYTVQRPVQQTVMQARQYTVMQPVTTMRTQYVDRGGYVNQMVLKPSLFRNRLEWFSGGPVVDPATGAVGNQGPGLYWTPTQRGRYEVKKQWVSNLVPTQVPVTTMVPQTYQQQVPVTTTTYQTERVCRKVPYSVTKMVPEVQVRRVPVTTYKPVTERIVRKVPVRVCRWVSEQRVNRIPVTTCRMKYEDHVKQVPVSVCRMERVCRKVLVPRCVEKRVPVVYTCTVPRTVVCRIPIDACGNPIVTESVVTEGTNDWKAAQEPTLASPKETTDETVDEAAKPPVLDEKAKEPSEKSPYDENSGV